MNNPPARRPQGCWRGVAESQLAYVSEQLVLPERADKAPPLGFERDSAISDTLEILTDPWRFLVIREAFYGARRFSQFASHLHIPRATLTKCLAQLVEAEILQARPLRPGSSWKEYGFTDRGRDMYAIFLGLMWYGDKWLWEGTPPIALFHKPSRRWFSPEIVWEHNRAPVEPHAVRFVTTDGYWVPREPRGVRSYRMQRSSDMKGLRPCSMERTISIVGDRWTFLILQEFFHGNNRFDDFMKNLGIATNILSDRLRNLSASGFIEKRAGDNGLYRLTPKGRDIYGPMILMKTWGDRWLRQGRKITSQFIAKSTGEPTRAIVVVPGVGVPVQPREMDYAMNYERYVADFTAPRHR